MDKFVERMWHTLNPFMQLWLMFILITVMSGITITIIATALSFL